MSFLAIFNAKTYDVDSFSCLKEQLKAIDVILKFIPERLCAQTAHLAVGCKVRRSCYVSGRLIP